MHRALEVNRQVDRLRNMLFVHTIADGVPCEHSGYALGLRMGASSDLSVVGVESHRWQRRILGAAIPSPERETLMARFPGLRTVWNNPLWEVLKDNGSHFDSQQCFDSVVGVDHPMRRFSHCSMQKWVGVPEPERIREMVLLLKNDDHSLHLQRWWMMKHLAPYVLVASTFAPFRPVAAPLYRCIRDLPLNKPSMVDSLHGYLPISPTHWDNWVNAAQQEATEWLGSRKGRTQELARRWLWDMLPSSDFQRRLSSRLKSCRA